MTLNFSLAASIYLDLEQWKKSFIFPFYKKKVFFPPTYMEQTQKL